jgi:DNA-binding response OmpR family regulator
MAGMEAEEIVAAMRTVTAYDGIPILLFSALDEAEGHRRCLQCGATAFVHKPRNWKAFVSAVATMVHRWEGAGDSQNRAPEREGKDEEENDCSRNCS